MDNSPQEISERLYQIFLKHKNLYKNPPKSKQMCCMWSTIDPPDIIEDTPPILDIEEAFNISINENDCLEFYDMSLQEAVNKIAKMIKNKC